MKVSADPLSQLPRCARSRANPQGEELPALELRFKATKAAEDALSCVKAASFIIKASGQ